jgi:hypothetical protein
VRWGHMSNVWVESYVPLVIGRGGCGALNLFSPDWGGGEGDLFEVGYVVF